MRKLPIVLAAVALAVPACAQNESPTLEGSPPPEETSSAAVNDHGTKTFTEQEFEAELELDNFYFEPTFIKSPGDAKATLELHNEGSVPHTFTVDALNIDEELEPDATKTITVEIGTETRYEFYCRFHRDQGMSGAFMPH
ncbi:MAG TPA: cupredoxin domain-containing protein [Actinomycetota bacterium]|nr:cupredoxin domain-containing protein [Actinomycetota bacterium]